MPSIGFMALKARDDDVPFGFVREDNEIIPWRYSKVSSPASGIFEQAINKRNSKHSS